MSKQIVPVAELLEMVKRKGGEPADLRASMEDHRLAVLSRFEPSQRERLLHELRESQEIACDSVDHATHREGLDPLPSETLSGPEKYQKNLAITTAAIKKIEALGEDEPPVLVGPLWFIQYTVGGIASYLNEILSEAFDEYRGTPSTENRAKLLQALHQVRLWTRSTLASYGHEPA
jgi:hypothetical protein